MPEASFNKAFALFRLGKYNEALTACEAALTLQPNDRDTLNLHEEIVLSATSELVRLQSFARAADILHAAVIRHPDSVKLLVNLGFTELARGHFQESVSALDKALWLDHRNTRAHLGKALALCRGLNRHADAHHHFHQAVVLGDRDAAGLMEECQRLHRDRG